MSPLGIVATAVWAMLPAYVPNNIAVIVGGGLPIDGGRTWGGTRLLGDGKTWRGTAGGWLAGALIALILNHFQPVVTNALGVRLPEFPLLVALAFPLGAMVGDIAASFFKRRIGRVRGTPLWGLDQLDFVLGALTFALAIDPEWFFDTFTLSVLAIIVVLTPILHLVTNCIAYLTGLKDEPW